MKHILLFILVLSSPVLLADLKIGEPPPFLILEGKAGGRVDGSAWSSAELTGKVHVLMYVDPDKVKVNSHVEEALADEEFDPRYFATIGAINMAASWKPDFAIDLILKAKQEKYPNTVYVRDKNRAFVSQWGLVDQGYHVLGVSGDGKIIFSAATKLTADQIRELIELIRKHISR
ncbi:MAG: transcriptional regulator [Acidiferrobacteraceae bacterium]|nr:transcriptional regulator [Acidiferrobacteraceae bacterium]MBT7352667.1 transcriptional regulator [Acidiferrobacteraceae bacterium]